MSTYRDLNDYEIMYLVEEENDDARELLFEKYKPIIYRLAISYQKEAKQYGLELEDLIQEEYTPAPKNSATFTFLRKKQEEIRTKV